MLKKLNKKSLQKYEDKLFELIDKYATVLYKVIDAYKNILYKLIDLLKKFIFSIIKLIEIAAKIMRYATFPLHWINIKIGLRKRKEDITNLPIFTLGAHYFYGEPGSGKSTVVYHAMMDYAYFTGKCSYTTEYFETPRIDLLGRPYYYHQVFSPSDFFAGGEQIAAFDSSRFNIVVYEEMLMKYQQRRNKEASYNNEVLPMIAALGTQRHQYIDLFYFISQLPRNDIALMQMLVKYHVPKIRKTFDYKHWLDTGKFRLKIKGWHMTTYDIVPTSGHDYKLTNKRRWWYRNKYPKDFEYFNRLNMAVEFAKLPTFKGDEMKSYITRGGVNNELV